MGLEGPKKAIRALTRDEILALPAVTDLVTAGRAFDIGRSKAHELARRGEFPVPVLRLGKTYKVRTADLLRLLGIEPADSESPGDVA